MSVLETFIHDPLVEWTKSHKLSGVEVQNPHAQVWIFGYLIYHHCCDRFTVTIVNYKCKGSDEIDLSFPN